MTLLFLASILSFKVKHQNVWRTFAERKSVGVLNLSTPYFNKYTLGEGFEI